MPTYISLINWTERGAAGFKSTVDRAEAGKALAGTFGGALKEIYWTLGAYDIVAISEAPDDERAGACGGARKEIYWTLGAYDIVAISEAPDDESATAFALALASQGNVRTTTMRAFDGEEMRAIIAKAP